MEGTTLHNTPEVREAISQLELALGSAGIQPLNTLLMALAALCTVTGPPEPNWITVRSDGRLIFRCERLSELDRSVQ